MNASHRQSAVILDAYEAYARWAPSYDETPNPLTALEERLLSPLLGGFARRDIVDLGCGTGRWLQRMESIAPRSLAGIDASPAMLARAARKCSPSTLLIEADCTSTPLAGCSADLVLGSFLLSYVPEIGRFAAEAARILRSGGTVIVSDLHPYTDSYGWRRSFRTGSEVFEIATFPYRLDELTGGMKAQGVELQDLVEARFGEDEEAIFRANDMEDQFRRVEALPVLYYARFVRR